MNALSLFTVRRLRLASGGIMFFYLATHILNHALGLLSLRLAEDGLTIAMAVWRNPVTTLVLYGAALLHFGLALWSLYSRREWHLRFTEIVRYAAGFSFPLLLIRHAVATRLADALYGLHPSYATIVAGLVAQGKQGLQLALLVPGWIHGCLGLWMALRHFNPIGRWQRPLMISALTLPLLAAGGFLRMAAAVSAAGLPPPSPAAFAALASLAAWQDRLTIAYETAIVAAFVAGRVRAMLIRRREPLR